MTPASSLRQRVAQATGADTQLDHDIMNACGFACRQDFINDDRGSWFWFAPDGERFEHYKLTASVDAALALVEKLLPGWQGWELHKSSTSHKGTGCFFMKRKHTKATRKIGHSHTPALAVLSALLAALEA